MSEISDPSESQSCPFISTLAGASTAINRLINISVDYNAFGSTLLLTAFSKLRQIALKDRLTCNIISFSNYHSSSLLTTIYCMEYDTFPTSYLLIIFVLFLENILLSFLDMLKNLRWKKSKLKPLKNQILTNQ